MGFILYLCIMKKYICQECKKEFESKKGCKSRTPKYCSKECYSESLKLHIKCKLCGCEIENKHSVSMKNRIYCSKECQSKSRQNIPLTDEWKKALSDGRKKSEKCKGENLYNWRGGENTFHIRMKEYYYKRKKNLCKNMPIDFLEKLIIWQDNKCFFCESDLSEYKAIEHLTPVSKGGDNDIFNLVYSCKSCNSKKRVNTLEEYSFKNKRYDWLKKWERMYIELL